MKGAETRFEGTGVEYCIEGELKVQNQVYLGGLGSTAVNLNDWQSTKSVAAPVCDQQRFKESVMSTEPWGRGK